ncbi:abc protein [Apiospora sp. TS-2023a]
MEFRRHSISATSQHGREKAPTHHFSLSFLRLRCYALAAEAQMIHGGYASGVRRLIAKVFRQQKTKRVEILRSLDGIVTSGEMLLVLGRPGSGCSTFLKALSGNTAGFRIADDTKVNYQGISYEQMGQKFKGERIYLAELDVHFPELTVGRTLEFASAVRMRNTDLTTGPLFGLEGVLKTKVGNAKIRGISGGEQRRLSIAEAFIGGAQCQFWDNSTRGIDSKTAKHVVDILRDSAKSNKSTVFMSLYQASESMYRSFDKVTVLYEGRQIYFGPVQTASEYFTALGFVKSDNTSTADYLTSLTSPKERRVRQGFERKIPQTADEFAAAWNHSVESQKLRAEIEAFDHANSPKMAGCESTKNQMAGNHRPRSANYPLPLLLQFRLCIRRALHRVQNNFGPPLSAVISNCILGIVIGSAFFGLSETSDSLQQRAVLLFFALMMNAFAPEFEVSLMWAQRPIVEKHHQYAFYFPFSEAVASMISDLPTKLIIGFGIHIPVYFLAGLRSGAAPFFTYWFFMFVNLVTMSMIFRFIGSVSRRLDQTLTPVSVTVLLAIIYTGFVVPPSAMRPWLAWFWRINPLAYTYESLMVNEMHGRQFPCTTPVPSGIAYSNVSWDDKVCAVVGSERGLAEVRGTAYLYDKYGYTHVHLWRNMAILLAMMVFFCCLHLAAAQFVKTQPSQGEVLVFRHKTPRRRAADPRDIEHAAATTPLEPSTSESHPTGECNQSCDNKPASNHPTRHAAAFYWKNLSYSVKIGQTSRKIVTGINGWVKPGTLTVLMGVTGAGKTTLLDVLASRTTTGIVSGNICVSNRSRTTGFQRRVGYAQQQDIHLPSTTVREALEFSALLRQTGTRPRKEKLAYVDTVLQTLDMHGYADAVVGSPGEGLNIEQRKRLTIAVEMVARPDPTSGLDSQTAWSICTLLRRLVNNGQTILCTVHQPSSELFSMFGRLLLLDKGGKTLFFGNIGPSADTPISYFEEKGAPKYEQGDNPAEWMLDVTAANDESSGGSSNPQKIDWAQEWDLSTAKAEVLRQLADFESTMPAATALSQVQDQHEHEYAASVWMQLLLLTQRIVRDQWRDSVYMYTKTTLCVGLALINGISFLNSPLDIQGVTSILFSLFLLMQMFTGVGQLVTTSMSGYRDLFETRERNSKTYSWVVFLSANCLVEMFWQVLISFAMFVAWYYPIGLRHHGDAEFGSVERGALIFVLTCFFNIWSCTFCQVFAASVSHPSTSLQIATLFYWLSLTFSGVVIPPSTLPTFWVFMYRVSPLTYFVQGIAVAGVAHAGIQCSPVEMSRIPIPGGWPTQVCGDYLAAHIGSSGGYVADGEAVGYCDYCPVSDVDTVLAASLGMDTRYPWRNAGLMAAYIGFNVAALFGLYRMTRVRSSSWGERA